MLEYKKNLKRSHKISVLLFLHNIKRPSDTQCIERTLV